MFPPAGALRWFRIELPPTQHGERVLAVAKMPIRDVRLYVRDAESGWREQRDNYFRPDADRHSPQAFAFVLPSDATVAYLRTAHGGQLYLGARVLGAREFERDARHFVVLIGIALTALAAC